MGHYVVFRKRLLRDKTTQDCKEKHNLKQELCHPIWPVWYIYNIWVKTSLRRVLYPAEEF